MPIVLLPDDFDMWSLDLPIDELLPELSVSDEAYTAGGFGGVPASGKAVAGLKRQKHGDDDAVMSRQTKRPRRRRGRTGTGHESTTDKEAATAAVAECAICLEDFEAGDGLAVMPCAHRFHEGCLTEWLALSRLCPCCRHALPCDDDEVVGEAPSAATTTSVAEGGGARRRRRRRHKTRRSSSGRACRPNVRLLGRCGRTNS